LVQTINRVGIGQLERRTHERVDVWFPARFRTGNSTVPLDNECIVDVDGPVNVHKTDVVGEICRVPVVPREIPRGLLRMCVGELRKRQVVGIADFRCEGDGDDTIHGEVG
jgi:hypothetical protein